MHRQFAVDKPDRLWLTDITEHPNRRGEAIPLRGDGRLFSPNGRMVNRPPHAHRTHARHTRHGDPPSPHRNSDNAVDTIGHRYDNSMMESFWVVDDAVAPDSMSWTRISSPERPMSRTPTSPAASDQVAVGRIPLQE